jgi:alkaline phosphatase
MLGEMVELDRTVKVVVEWALPRKDTLVVVLADHETGGLRIVKGNAAGTLPEVAWTTGGHTGVDIRVMAWGPGAEKFGHKLDNTDIFRLLSGREPYPPKATAGKAATPAPAPAPTPTPEPAGVGAGY